MIIFDKPKHCIQGQGRHYLWEMAASQSLCCRSHWKKTNFAVSLFLKWTVRFHTASILLNSVDEMLAVISCAVENAKRIKKNINAPALKASEHKQSQHHD